MQLEGKVAIVTGAAGGIGRACAERFADEGARVVLSDIDGERGEAAAEALRARGHAARFIACDVGDGSQTAALVAATLECHGGLDILVNSAGVIERNDFLDLAEADFDHVLRVNLKGTFLAGQAAARRMAEQGRGGAIVNLSSVGAVMAIPDQVAYNVSKGGVAQLTRVMALALAPHGIRVNAIGPGAVETEMIGPLLKDGAWRETILSRTPLGRLGKPAEIAAVALFLAGEEASYVTGQTVFCDGGRLALNYLVEAPDGGSDPLD